MPRKKSGYDSLTVLIPQDLAKKVRALAREDGRHLSKMVELLLRDGLITREQPVTQGTLFNSAPDGGSGG
jgi:hypothetical protein